MTKGLLGGTALLLSPARVMDVWNRSATAKAMNLRLIIFIRIVRLAVLRFQEMGPSPHGNAAFHFLRPDRIVVWTGSSRPTRRSRELKASGRLAWRAWRFRFLFGRLKVRTSASPAGTIGFLDLDGRDCWAVQY